jgi:periplasmic divalent cation tolerance protein
METADECTLLIKTRVALFTAVERAVKDWHPYELPEIVAVPTVCGSNEYLTWLAENTREPL